MHYYQFNIADYRKDTVHLTPLEHYFYRHMLDSYYLSEQPIPIDENKMMRSLCVRNADDMQAVKSVLNDFFLLTDKGYIHKRCDIEIESYHAKSKSASESAKARWANRNKPVDANALQTQSEGNANHKPLTINQEPRTNNHKPLKTVEVINNNEISNIVSAKIAPKKGTALPDDWVLPKAWGEWALSERPDFTVEQVRKIAESFKDHWVSNSNQAKSKKADWLAAWRNWIRNQKNSTRHNQATIADQNKLNAARAKERLFGSQKTEKDITDATTRL